MPTYKFIDLFAGLGGFHLALEQLGCKCVFASELQQDLRTLYESNFGMKCAGDINLINIEKDIPSHDILCGGFPCQPFSQAGKQQGFQDEKERGNLFNKIMEVLEFHKPEFVFLENVPNLKSHDKGNTYRVIHEKLSMLYEVKEDIISPHYFGIPQHRTRMYIVGRLKSRGGLQTFAFPKHEERPDCDISQILIPEDTDYMSLRPVTRKHMAAWQKFLDLLSQNKSTLPTFPIWAMEFGATYDYEGVAPYFQKRQQLSGKKGKFGEDIVGNSKDDFLQLLPIYSQGKPKTGRQFPDWKKQFIRQNRQFYQDNKSWIDAWIDEIKQEGFENSHQKFEWNCGYEEHPTIYNKIMSEQVIKFINSKLTKREKYIMCSRYGLNGHIQKTQQQIADELGISRSYVSRIETKVQNKLKKYDNINFICCDAETYRFNQKYDSIMVFNALPHFVNPKALIKNLVKDLTSGGIVTFAHDRGRKSFDRL